MANILVVVGSGRKGGNTDQLADAFIEGTVQAGHVTAKVFLGDKILNGCTGCNACRWGKPCVQKDAMTDIYPLYMRCDTVVLASPLNFWTITSRLKAFLERLYAVAEEDPAPPKGRYERYAQKNCALLMTAADDLFWTFELAVAYYRFNCVNYLGWIDKGMILAGGCGGSPIPRCIGDTGHLATANEFGRNF